MTCTSWDVLTVSDSRVGTEAHSAEISVHGMASRQRLTFKQFAKTKPGLLQLILGLEAVTDWIVDTWRDNNDLHRVIDISTTAKKHTSWLE